MAQVTIYTTPSCGYCKIAKAFFQEHNIEYAEKDVAADEAAREELFARAKAKGASASGVPVIFVDDEMVMGFDKAKLSGLLGIA